MASSIYIPSTEISSNDSSDNEDISISQSNDFEKNTEKNTEKSLIQKKQIDYNDPTFKFEPDSESRIYIFKNNLFTRVLLPIENDKPRRMIIKCTT